MELEEVDMFRSENISEIVNRTYEETFEICPAINMSPVYTAVQVFCAVICVIGILGNTTVIYVVLRYSKMKTITNTYILNLAIADECFLIGIPFVITTMSLGSWPFGYFFCKAYMISTGVNQFTSSIFLCIMSADRYIAVCHPTCKLRTPVISRIVSLSAWIVSVLVMTPIFMYTTLISTYSGSSCNIIWPETDFKNGQTIFILYSFALGFAVPLTFIFIFYSLVIHKIKIVGLKIKPDEQKRSHKKVTKLVLVLIAVYVICWLPYWACQLSLINYTPGECAEKFAVIVFLVAACLSYSNSAINPIFYAFLSDSFRKSFSNACSCIVRKSLKCENEARVQKYPMESGTAFVAEGSRTEASSLTSKSVTISEVVSI